MPPIIIADPLDAIRHETCSWHSWSGNECHPQKIFFPESVQEVQNIIRIAVKNTIPVRFIGSGHSLNDLVCTDNGYLVNTDKFNKILKINTKKNTVRVECGIKLKHFYKQLAQHGLALQNQGFIKEQSIAGALATGTHGTGKTGTLSDFIISIELIDSQGKYHVISTKSNPEWLQAARLHLGALGFVYAVTLQCVPLFVLTHKRKMKSWAEVLANFDTYYNNNDYLMMMAHPISENVLVYTWNKTNEAPTNNFFIQLQERLFSNEVTNYLTIKFAKLTPELTNDFINALFKAMQQKEHRELSYKTLSPIKNPLEVQDYIEQEIAIPIEHFVDAIKDVFALYKNYEKKDFELVGFMTCRFVKGSEKALLSPTYGRDSAYISLITLSCFKRYKEFYAEFEQLMSKYGAARSHWGKYNDLTKERVQELYGENLAAFNQVRAQLDPHNVFTNNYITQRLGMI
jgi:FAD/FMN-containing dehydrogenase